jgi:hypothetical protein
MTKIIRYVTFSIVGAGKSSVTNAITGEHTCPISGDPESCTHEVEIVEKNNGNVIMRVMDTPGFDDPNGREADLTHYKAISYAIREEGSLNAILILFNARIPRFGDALKAMLRQLASFMKPIDFLDHVGIVFTHWYDAESEFDSNRKQQLREEYVPQILSVLREGADRPRPESQPEITLETFFVDADSSGLGQNTRDEISRLIEWSESLSALSTESLVDMRWYAKTEEIIEEKPGDVVSAPFYEPHKTASGNFIRRLFGGTDTVTVCAGTNVTSATDKWKTVKRTLWDGRVVTEAPILIYTQRTTVQKRS